MLIHEQPWFSGSVFHSENLRSIPAVSHPYECVRKGIRTKLLPCTREMSL